MLDAELAHPHSLPLVIAGEGRLAGYALLRHLLDEAELLRLAVDPSLRRAGLGRQLLAAAFGELRSLGVTRCWLEARADDAAAVAFYRACGFVQSGRRPGYYRDGCDALLMQREVGEAIGLLPRHRG